MSDRISAPGKVFLAGEYAVLEGHPALVVGVDKRIHATVKPADGVHLIHRPSGAEWKPPASPPPELRFAARAFTLAGGRDLRVVFEDDFKFGDLKIGLGGSAAACVLAVRAARPDASDEEVMRIAAEAHLAEQGGKGSGADVAACAMGGVLEARSKPLTARRVRVPEDLRLLLAFTGKPADTRELIATVRRDPPVIAHIARACGELTAALESGDRQAALAAVRSGAAAMKALGVMTVELERVCALASDAGATAKPSGAGGGDCAVIFAFGDAMADRAEKAVRPHFPVFRVVPAC
ncbi:MAG TPA: hypothetical protein VLW85_01990 [Myxococcales bacterium]|nr:hypothetical protein [Myxococcales bacterium]